MAKQRGKKKKLKNRLRDLRRKAAGRKKGNEALIEKGREILLQMIELNAPPELLHAASEAIDAAMQGDPLLLEHFVEIAEEDMSLDQPTEIAFPFSSEKAAGFLREAWSNENQSVTVELCQRALAADPNSADAMVLMGDLASVNRECVQWYQKASESISQRHKKADLHAVSACRCHMGRQLMERTLFADAFEIMTPVLEFSPDTVRIEMLQIALMLEWHDELYTVLGKGEPLDGLDDYVEAIAAFQIHGDSEVSRRLLKKAYRGLPETARYLTSQAMVPKHAPSDPASMAAIATAQCVLPAMRTKAGLVKWVRDTLDLQSSHETEKSDDGRPQKESFGDPPQVDEVWQFHIIKQKGKSHLLCLNENAPVHFAVLDDTPDDRERVDFLFRALNFPAIGEARKPLEIKFDTRKSQLACRHLLGNLNINSSVLEKDKSLRKALKLVVDNIMKVVELAETPSPETAIDPKQLKSIPVAAGVRWIVSIHRVPIWIHDQATPRRCWNVHVVDADTEMIVGLAQSETELSPQNVFDELGNMMLQRNPPLKPECVVIEPRTDERLFADLSEVVRCDVGDASTSEAMLGILHPMVESVCQCRAAIDLTDGISDKDLESYYAAASRYFKQSPWRLVQGDRVVGVRSLDSPDQKWGVSVIGQMGETLGISIVEGIENAFAMIRGTANMTDLNLISVQFGEDFDMIPTDLLMLEWRKRELANADAFPLFLKMKPGSRECFCPNQQELQMTTMLLNELPSFLKSSDVKSDAVTMETPNGRRYSLSFNS
jgi:hypothetical protein